MHHTYCPDPDQMCQDLIALFQHMEADRAEVLLSDSRISSMRVTLERLMSAVEQFQRLRDTGPSDEQQITAQLEQEMRATMDAIRAAEEKFHVSVTVLLVLGQGLLTY
ncbi:unnamed protein product [Echinostoma caproni]|uniref:V-SNARE domain-containing protein n=1 Tax=Echinostoma caproni TaxID=27848 RepID=A0A183BBR0_9TREM|nr:unnamed protein product [Echinostoma caproni]